MHSSTSIDMRLRNIMVVGFMSTSPSEIVGELQREAARRPHAALHRFGHLLQVRIAVGQLRRRIRDADHRPAVEDHVAEALGLQPRAMHESIEVLTPEPVAAPQRV